MKSIAAKFNRRSIIGRVRRMLLTAVTLLNQMDRIPGNQVVPDIWDNPILLDLVSLRISQIESPVILLGELYETQALISALKSQGINVTSINWTWGQSCDLTHIPASSTIIVCKTPLDESGWRVIQQLRQHASGNVVGLHELVLPVTTLLTTKAYLPYHTKDLNELVRIYTKDSEFRDIIQALTQRYSLTGKRVIEFGPMEGYQTLLLAKAGAKVTSIEARPENYIKTMVACYFSNERDITLIMDDFHNVETQNYGKFDLAFAHGVYYHSMAPFLFFENLMSLSDHVFLGGFCATDDLPEGKFEVLNYQGHAYRAKSYLEVNDHTAGVNKIGYFFHPDDLVAFFVHQGYDVDIISNKTVPVTAGRYVRFLASKR